MSKFAVIPFDEVVCRSDELTPTEFRVLCYLYGRRNRKTGQCNPRQAEIGRGLKVDRAHILRALIGLREKGWIVPDEAGNKLLTIPVISGKPTLPFTARRGGRNVAKSATIADPQDVAKNATIAPLENVADSATSNDAECATNDPGEGVRNAQHDGAIFATRGCGMRNNTPYSSLNKERTKKEHSRGADPDSNTASADGGKTALQKIASAEPIEKPTKRVGERIPDPFMLTKDMRDYAAKRRPNVDVEEETEKFVNYWRSKPGKDGRKLDWLATWRNWILNAKPSYQNRNGQRLSEREKSAERIVNSHRFIDALERGDSEDLGLVLGGGSPEGTQIDIPGERPGTH